MQQRRIGELEVSLVGVGCNNFGAAIDAEATARVVHRALDLGVTIFDTADTYGNRGRSEEFLGQALRGRRDKAVVATKFGMAMDDRQDVARGSRAYVRDAVEASLRRLGTDWIDLYQMHRPDPKTPIEETLETLQRLKEEGKIREIGCSTLPAWQLVEDQWVARTHALRPFASCQAEYSLLRRGIEAELVPALQAYDVKLLPYFPLASGLLTGKYANRTLPAGARLERSAQFASRHLSEGNWQRLDALEAICAEHGCTILELAFGWLVSRPFVASIVAGATSAGQVESKVAAASAAIPAEAIAAVDALDWKSDV